MDKKCEYVIDMPRAASTYNTKHSLYNVYVKDRKMKIILILITRFRVIGIGRGGKNKPTESREI